MGEKNRDNFVRDRLPVPQDQPEFLFDLPELAYPERMNAAAELLAGKDRDAPAILNAAGRWSYGEIEDLSSRIARLLVEEEGLVPGNRVFLRGPNGATLFAAWLGILKAGGIVVATMPVLRGAEIAKLLNRAEISHAIVDDRGAEDFKTGAKQAGTLRSTLFYHGDEGGGNMEKRLERTAPGLAAIDTHRDDPALIAFTSGTTGEPKGCVHYHRDILASADSFAAHIIRPKPGMRWACSAPLAFTFGLGQLFIFPFRFAGTAVTLEAPSPPVLLEAVARFKVDILATAPTAYRAMLPLLAEHDISSLEICVSAGEHLPAATWHAWKEATGIGIIDGIGATEMMHIFISASGEDIRPGATGKPVPGYKACLLGENDQPLDPPAEGRLAVKGPTGCRYFDDPRQKDYVIKGWNVTGDTYREDDEGYFWYVARSDDMIVSAGYNIAAPEVENALLSHEAVAECAVVGVPCEERGRKVKAFIVLAEGQAPGAALAEKLQAHVKAEIAPYKYPRAIEFVDSLPKTATGKLKRHALRE
ncbi:MAG: AMP-binding protein [Sphingomonadaceae bacterium]